MMDIVWSVDPDSDLEPKIAVFSGDDKPFQAPNPYFLHTKTTLLCPERGV